MHRCVLALGSNLGDRGQTLFLAIGSIAKIPQTSLEGVSPIVESHALTPNGFDNSQPNYLNCVVEVKTDLSPKALLQEINSIETKFGRERSEKWASRTLDIDIVTFGKQEIETDGLIIPHPRAHERGFVLVPWMLLDENAVLPGFGSVSQLAQKYASEVWVIEDAD
ncbi:MAG: 2-amino-4-hydroxy-6-hydroxymethyldihydropteridine diphosphokinase [Actinomycetota bacterium]|jgi:2-amino-4-hydroxy-6-hydroxymethyldihydropteridine diphosphokinase